MGIKSIQTIYTENHNFEVKDKDVVIKVDLLTEEHFYPFEERSEEITKMKISSGENSKELTSDFEDYTDMIEDFIISLFNANNLSKEKFLTENQDISEAIENMALEIEEKYKDYI